MSLKGISILAFLSIGVAVATGTPIITQFTVAGVPQVVRTQSGGYVNGLQSSNQLGYNTDTDRIHVADTSNGGYTLFWLDPTVYGDVGGSHDSRTGAVRNWGTSSSTGDLYAGTVTGDTKIAISSYGLGFAYVPSLQSMFVKSSSGNNTGIHEYQAARTDAGVDLVGEGTTGDMTNSARLLSAASPTLTTGNFHTGLAFLGSGAGTLEFFFIDRRGGLTQTGRFLSLAEPRDTDPTATTAGTRTLSLSGSTVASADLNALVRDQVNNLDINDLLTDVANDLNGNIWALSHDGNDTYLSAFTLAGTVVTQIDLDPDTANLHVQLTGITLADASTATFGYGLAVNGDASKIYVLADGGGSAKDEIFIYNMVPEPATLALLSLGVLPLLRRRRKG